METRKNHTPRNGIPQCGKLWLLAACIALAACGNRQEAPAAGEPQDVTVVRIGHVAPTTGANAHLGKDNEYGALLAAADLNAEGITIGGQKVRIELLLEDDASDPKQGTAVAQKLVDAKVSGVVGHLNSGTSIPASRIYHEAGIPQITPAATNPRLTRQGFRTTFRVVADDTRLGSALGQYAVTTLQSKAIAVIDDRTAYGQGVAEEFIKAVQQAGGNIVAREFTTDKAVDFAPILTSIKGKQPDLIFLGGLDAVAGPMLKQMKALAIDAKFMGGDGICSSALYRLSGNTIADDKVFCAEAGGVEGVGVATLEAFKARFRARFGTDVQLYAPYVYDAVRVMVAAMQQAGSADPAHYLPVLAATRDYPGITGPISFDEKGDLRNGALTFKTIRAGKLATLAVVR
ncbi:branched-chain amino acid ABC transporter substrate-binding protein [Candidatus Symbiobacter mobilis]|uniref:Branched-chain amino acid transporter substrate-binding protein n=1 Tax=Candidatus Symbiobacter mobilis CR TaxID=946483 RepID=U5ND51_9BURK|nr:branched-chain amino acid ABC transporter substrate-binding protein [Candidatus Symbiobacter mobilis]AGX88099.1 branched-chain amino acid transporter substrate-binding protein [Candidatus Symbiobacter mobilis CR]